MSVCWDLHRSVFVDLNSVPSLRPVKRGFRTRYGRDGSYWCRLPGPRLSGCTQLHSEFEEVESGVQQSSVEPMLAGMVERGSFWAVCCFNPVCQLKQLGRTSNWCFYFQKLLRYILYCRVYEDVVKVLEAKHYKHDRISLDCNKPGLIGLIYDIIYE